MIQRISAPISLVLVYDHSARKLIPKKLKWEGKTHNITSVDMHHITRDGRTLKHVFSVASATMFFKIVMDTSNLQWMLEEISDGLTD